MADPSKQGSPTVPRDPRGPLLVSSESPRPPPPRRRVDGCEGFRIPGRRRIEPALRRRYHGFLALRGLANHSAPCRLDRQATASAGGSRRRRHGVCCDDACTSLCFACSAIKKASGDDGTCGQIVWADPDNECDDEGAASCGKNGLCSQGACATYSDGTLCHAASRGGGYYTSSAMCSGGKWVPSGTALGCAGRI